jgi:hypothetical protein
MSRTKQGNVRINFMIQPKVLDGFKVLAARRHTSYSDLLRVAARSWLIEELKKP